MRCVVVFQNSFNVFVAFYCR